MWVSWPGGPFTAHTESNPSSVQPLWNEPSAGVAVSALNHDAVARQPLPAVVDSVEPGSIGEDLGFEPGDQLLSINGIRPRDLIDYRYLCVEEDLHLEVRDAAGELHQVDLEKDADDGLGLAFTEALFDGLRQCNNHCPFCFIDQQPPGHRDSLYLKDDDFRLSFLTAPISPSPTSRMLNGSASMSNDYHRCTSPCMPPSRRCVSGCW